MFKSLIEYLPFKQGLRREDGRSHDHSYTTHRVSSIQTRIKTVRAYAIQERRAEPHRVSSIQTRIKTLLIDTLLFFLTPHRVSSIQTRIKTQFFSSVYLSGFNLIEYLPFKQGLRQRLAGSNKRTSHS